MREDLPKIKVVYCLAKWLNNNVCLIYPYVRNRAALPGNDVKDNTQEREEVEVDRVERQFDQLQQDEQYLVKRRTILEGHPAVDYFRPPIIV